MKVKNLTSKIQEQKLISLADNREFSIYIEPYGSAEIIDAYILDKSKFNSGVLDIVGGKTPEISKKIKEKVEDHQNDNKDKAPADDNEDKIPTDDDDKGATPDEGEGSKDSPDTNEGKFICEVCGAEFASDRGLKSHMSRVHPEIK